MTDINTSKLNNLNVSSLDALAEHGMQRVCVAIGVFDGVHRGHQLLIQRLLKMAKKNDATPIALTFYPHPRAILQPKNPPPLLVTPSRRIKLLHNYGVCGVVTLAFSESFARQSAEDFINNCLHSPRVAIKGVCVGKKWRFGAKGCGSVKTLENLAAARGFDLEAVEELQLGNTVVSSTAIRQAIAAGRLKQAANMLGRNYTLSGVVETGYRIAGEELAHPTANIKMAYGVLPPWGVYAAQASYADKTFAAGVNIGIAPTYHHLNTAKVRVEAHLLDYTGDLYGQEIELTLLKYLREERCFNSSFELKTQITKDISTIRNLNKNTRG